MKKTTAIILATVLIFTVFVSCSGPGEDADRVSIAEDYIKAFINQDYKELGTFSLTFRMRWSLNNRVYKTIKDQVEQEFGKFIEIAEVSENISGEYMIVSSVCRFSERYGNLNVVFDKNNRIAGFNYTYNKTYSENNNEIEVIFGSDYNLPGSLLVPESSELVPAVIIVHGSGPGDRNGAVGGSAVYFDVAMGLYDKRIASLRYDKRTYVYTDNEEYDMNNFTVYDETIDDVVKAFEFLRVQPGVDPEKIYITGHSLGGYLMPRIAKELPEAAGFIMLAPNASHIEDLMVEQTEYIYGLDGSLTVTEKKSINDIKDTAKRIKDLEPGDVYDSNELFNAPVSYWLDLQDYRPLQEIKMVGRPILIIHGDRDYQVNLTEYKKWHDAVLDMINAESVLMPGLNHIMAYGEEQSTPQEYYLLSEVDSSVIDLMAEFIERK